MNKKREWRWAWNAWMIVIMVCASLLMNPLQTKAAENQPVKIKVTYNQTDARAMLADINAFRTSPTDAWCWNSSDTEKEAYQGAELSYDYELERVAMKRAAEIALSFAHTRPGGSECFTAYPSSYRACGENIAAGQMSAAEVMASWREDDQSYSGQGHRRNMLSKNFNAVGIGHVVYQGCHYWVQEFGDAVVDSNPSAVSGAEQVVDVEVAPSYITTVKTNLDDVTLKVGEKATAADFSLALNIKDHWGYTNDCVIENVCSARVEDETIASFSDDAVITGLKEGTTKLWVSNPFGEEFYRTITVTKGAEEEKTIVISPIPDQMYTGSAVMPEVVVKDGSTVLKKNVDYTVLYSNNTALGTATVKITGKGTYNGSDTTTFKIIPCDMSKVSPNKIADKTYTGKAIEPTLTIYYKGKLLKKNTDYTVAYKDNTNIGTATVTITGKGNFTGTKTVTFKIVAPADVSVDAIADQTYTGSPLQPVIVVRDGSTVLKKNVNYTVSYSNNTNVGTATVKITGIGSYKGTYTTGFRIQPRAISESSPNKISNMTYTGKTIEPAVTIYYKSKLLRKGTDYTVAFKDNINVGTASVIITGIGNFTGTKTVTFRIVGKSSGSLTISAIPGKVYTGKEITPTVTVKDKTTYLKKDVDYKVSYSNNVNVGKATVIVTAIGSYQGTAKATFDINACSLNRVSVDNIPNQVYTGNKVQPKVNVTYNGMALKENVDYKIESYLKNTDVGTASMTLRGMGNYTGSKRVTFTIERADGSSDDDEKEIHTTEINLSKSKVTLKVGKTYRLKAFVDAGSVDKVTFISSNKKVATVSSKGVIKAKKKGTVRIIVRSGTQTKQCKVTVKAKKK